MTTPAQMFRTRRCENRRENIVQYQGRNAKHLAKSYTIQCAISITDKLTTATAKFRLGNIKLQEVGSPWQPRIPFLLISVSSLAETRLLPYRPRKILLKRETNGARHRARSEIETSLTATAPGARRRRNISVIKQREKQNNE